MPVYFKRCCGWMSIYLESVSHGCFTLSILNETVFLILMTIKKIIKVSLKVIKKQNPTILVSLSAVFLDSSVANWSVWQMLPTSAGVDSCLVLLLGLLESILSPWKESRPILLHAKKLCFVIASKFRVELFIFCRVFTINIISLKFSISRVWGNGGVWNLVKVENLGRLSFRA